MSIYYESNEQIVIEIKKLMLESKISQRVIAEKLQIKPQGLTKLLTKKNFGFEDADKILSAMGYELVIDFQSKSDADLNTPQPLATRKKELLKQIERLQQAKPEPQKTKDTPIRETLDEKLARLKSEHDKED